MMQLDKNSCDIEILLDIKSFKTVKLKDLILDWWGYDRFMTNRIWRYTYEIQLYLFGSKGF